MSELSQRVGAIAESATLAITAKAKALRADGKPVIGYGAGEPDFPTPEPIVGRRRGRPDPANHRYTPAAGLPELRQAIAAKTKRDSGYEVDASQVVVTNGGKHAVYATCQVLLDPGDEVLLPAPYWVTYPEAISLAGGVTVLIPTDVGDGFRVSVEQLEAARTDRTKMLVFVSPSNPTGAVYPRGGGGHRRVGGGQRHLGDDRRDLRAPHLRQRPACLLAGGGAGRRRTLRCRQRCRQDVRHDRLAGRLDDRPAEVAKAATRMQSHTTSNVSNVAQRAALAAVTGRSTTSQDAGRLRPAPPDDVRDAQRHPGRHLSRARGRVLRLSRVDGLLDRIGGRTAATTMELAAIFLDEIRVAIVPGEAFGAPGYARFSFALGDDDLVEGLERITRLVG